MATIGASLGDEAVSVGRVYARAFATIAHNPVATLGLALLLGALPGLLMTWLMQSTAQTDFAERTPGYAIGVGAIFLLSYVVTLILTALVQGSLTRATVAESEGRKASLGECLSAALPVALPLVGLVILWALGIIFAAFFLLVPAVILMCMWAVAVPVMVDERVGIGTAFGRSRALTKGNRWRVLAVLLILLIGYFLLNAVAGLFLGAAAVFGAEQGPSLTASFVVTNIITGTLFSALWGTLAPSMYVDLRDAKEGGSMGDLQQVFS
ncbi:hypothetical protein [uncultured Sphingomonas sp.]|uniref:hypothetical protein n=1 Tax=uncultured Sphingomonas sp. TaxID=158754 RepID=UPI0025EEFAAA|nr:hypothetical protein [uncultured Sphingomonas sp.]